MSKNVSDDSATESLTVSVDSNPNPALVDGSHHDEATGGNTAAEAEWNWSGDETNPHNWPSSKKWIHVVLVALFALVTRAWDGHNDTDIGSSPHSNMAPTICVPGMTQLGDEFQVRSHTISTLAITLYSLGLAIGPMFISPLSEVYGRLPVYHVTNFVFVAFIIASALSRNIAQFIIFRVLSGLAGGTPMALGGGTIADVTIPENRGVAMALFSLGPLAGPILGPVIGGFTAGPLGWRWSFWLLAIFSGAVALAAAILMSETYPKVLIERKDPRAQQKPSTPRLSPTHTLAASLLRPCGLLIRSPILLVLSVYVAFVSGTLYLLLTTFAGVFEGQYGFSTTVSGLSYLGLGAALIVAMAVFRVLGDRTRARAPGRPGQEEKEGPLRPESRLVLMIWFSPMVGLGLFLYGWTAYYKVHWIVPMVGSFVNGFGVFFVLMPAQLYLVDVFGSQSAASALGANNLLRFLSNTFLPLAGPPMYQSLGYGWGNTTLGFIALAFVPAPVLFYKYGDRLVTWKGVRR